MRLHFTNFGKYLHLSLLVPCLNCDLFIVKSQSFTRVSTICQREDQCETKECRSSVFGETPWRVAQPQYSLQHIRFVYKVPFESIWPPKNANEGKPDTTPKIIDLRTQISESVVTNEDITDTTQKVHSPKNI